MQRPPRLLHLHQLPARYQRSNPCCLTKSLVWNIQKADIHHTGIPLRVACTRSGKTTACGAKPLYLPPCRLWVYPLCGRFIWMQLTSSKGSLRHLSYVPVPPQPEVLPCQRMEKTHVVKARFCTLVWCPGGYAGLPNASRHSRGHICPGVIPGTY